MKWPKNSTNLGFRVVGPEPLPPLCRTVLIITLFSVKNGRTIVIHFIRHMLVSRISEVSFICLSKYSLYRAKAPSLSSKSLIHCWESWIPQEKPWLIAGNLVFGWQGNSRYLDDGKERGTTITTKFERYNFHSKRILRNNLFLKLRKVEEFH